MSRLLWGFITLFLISCLVLKNSISFQQFMQKKNKSYRSISTCQKMSRNPPDEPVPVQLRRYEEINEEIQDMFPRLTYANQYQEREYPDFEKLEPSDPMFLDMPWPTERGPAASAFARHLQWKRRLSDGERMKWQKWAIYTRMMKPNLFAYCVDDYIMQQLLRDLRAKEIAARSGEGQEVLVDATLWKAAQLGLLAEERDEVEAVMRGLYSILNHKNYDEVRTLWLPDPDVQLTLPGFDKTSGHFEVEKLYRRVMKVAAPLAQIASRTASVHLYGYVAVVHTVEMLMPGNDKKPLRKRGSPIPKPYKGPPPTVLATTVLRKFNEQWRIMSHHAVPYSASTSSLYCDEKLDVLDTLQRRSLVSSSSSSSVGNGESDSTSSGTSTSAESEFRRIFSAGSSASIGGGSSGSNGSNKGKSNADSSSTSTYNGLGDSTTVWRKLQGLMQEEGSGAAAGIVTRRNSDGGVERVVDIANVANPAITAYEKGGIFSDSDGEEMMSGSSGSMIESLVLQSAKDVFGPNVEFKRSKNGEMTLQRTKKDDSKNDDDDDDDVNEDEGITEIISESKRTPRGSSTNRVTSSAGVAVVSNPLYSGQSISTSKKTAQALRFLQKAKQISSETKNLLLLNIIDSAARDRVSLVETSFELLVLDHFIGSPEELYMWRPTTFDKGMDEFLDQCEEVAETIRKEQSLLKSSVSTVKSAVTKAGGKSEKKKSKDKNVDE